MSTYGLIEPFETEDLMEASADLAFALGVEWAMFRHRLLNEGRFTELVISHGSVRLVRMVERHNRYVECHPYCDGWDQIVVGDQRV
jgi:hypothetical protein